MTTYLWIGLGSALGGMARHAVNVAATARWGQAFPWGTIAINVSGSFLIGLLFAVTADGGRWPANLAARHFLLTGLMGGYTTFSAFSLQTLNLLRLGETGAAAVNVLLSVGVCLLAAWGGLVLGGLLNRG